MEVHGKLKRLSINLTIAIVRNWLVNQKFLCFHFAGKSYSNMISWLKCKTNLIFLFFWWWCSGSIPDPGVSGGLSQIEADSIPIRRTRIGLYPTTTDVRILYGSVPGYQTFRHPDTGSWYIRIFCKVFAEYSHEMSLDDMLKIIGEKILEFGQAQGTGEIMTPSDENRGSFKVLYFNPGFYKDSIRIESSNASE